jgi:hypothetical protein
MLGLKVLFSEWGRGERMDVRVRTPALQPVWRPAVREMVLPVRVAQGQDDKLCSLDPEPWQCYFQLQLGMKLSPAVVSCCCWVPSASMDQISVRRPMRRSKTM